ncbi:MAG: LysR family transcriptional regulator, partial [Caulobacteraceae bacterium]
KAPCPTLRGPVFDSSVLMTAAAASGLGVALAPAAMFSRDLAAERLIRPFDIEVALGGYWLTRLHSRPDSPAMSAFRDWVMQDTALGIG